MTEKERSGLPERIDTLDQMKKNQRQKKSCGNGLDQGEMDELKILNGLHLHLQIRGKLVQRPLEQDQVDRQNVEGQNTRHNRIPFAFCG